MVKHLHTLLDLMGIGATNKSTRMCYLVVFVCWISFILSVFANYWDISRAWLLQHNLKEPIIWTAVGSYVLALASIVFAVRKRKNRTNLTICIMLNTGLLASLFGLTGYVLLEALSIGNNEKPKALLLLIYCYTIGATSGAVASIAYGICRNWHGRENRPK